MQYIIAVRVNILTLIEKTISSAKNGDEIIVARQTLRHYASGILLQKRPNLSLKITVDEALCNATEKANMKDVLPKAKRTRYRRHAQSQVTA